ncbi:MAG: hypothetical protein J0M35_21215 [Candidatus Obscuribacter phosphatis]|uniref:Uncharacterized protein n=1 Tax=Candidatus Obscuribacter phosphatis TaxID=1906157 RepID=A0A8J7TPJ9_9BACT|nr:hypothetical protein [Candidatus Obscuribacter phosphatis]
MRKRKVMHNLRLFLSALLSIALSSSALCQSSEQQKFSPNNKLKAQIEDGKLYIKDRTDKVISQFVPSDSNGLGGSIIAIDWIDNQRLGIERHINPSLNCLTVSDIQGKTLQSYLGYKFYWSHNRKHLAHVGQMIHFSPWPHSEYIHIDDRTVYPAEGATYGEEARIVHTFSGPFAWSQDDSKLAVIDDLDGSQKGKFLVIIPGPANKTAKLEKYKLDEELAKVIAKLNQEEMTLSWLNSNSVSISSVCISSKGKAKSGVLPCTIKVN